MAAKIWPNFSRDRTTTIPLKFRCWVIVSIPVDAEEIGRRSVVVAAMRTVAHEFIAQHIRTHTHIYGYVGQHIVVEFR